jgi:hypothetical protein
MIRVLRTLVVFATIAVPLALGCVSSTTGDDELQRDEQAALTTPIEGDAIATPEFTCRPPVNVACQPGCCLLIDNRTTPPTWSCNDCR